MSATKKAKTSTPIEDPLSVDYAPTGRAACKKCQAPIAEGSVRVNRLVRSRFHDGFDTQLLHWRCGSEYAKSLDEFRGWMAEISWEDAEKLVAAMGDEFVKTDQLVGMYRKRGMWIQSAADHLAEAPVALLRGVLEANDLVFSDREKSASLAKVIADNFFFGKFPPCPTCNTQGLRQAGTDVRCHGWFSASTKCTFKFRFSNILENRPELFGNLPVGDELMTTRLSRAGMIVVPEEAQAHKAFKTLIVPKEVQAERKRVMGTSSSGGGGVASSVIATLDSEDEDLATTNPKDWMVGMRFVFCGVAANDVLELSKAVEKHGGAVWEDVVVAGPDRTTHLVIGEEELFKSPKAARYRKCADAGIPIVKTDFLHALTDVVGVESLRSDTASTEVEVVGRSKKLANAIINGKYILRSDLDSHKSDRPIYGKPASGSCPELFIYFSSARGKWKIAPSLDDGKGHVAINNDPKAERPDMCKHWEVFGGKGSGFSSDPNVEVCVRRKRKAQTNQTAQPIGPLLRQRKYLKTFVVEGSVGKKLPAIKEFLLAACFGKLSGKKKRSAPIPGTPIVTVDEECGEFRDAAIFVDSLNNVHNVLLTKTDAGTNVNKFYAIQLLVYKAKSASKNLHYAVFRKWGRFGSSGPMNGSLAVDFGANKAEAIGAFREKFTECTGLDFDLRDVSPQKPGRYAFVELCGQEEGVVAKKKSEKTQTTGKSTIPSQLPAELEQLMALIFDIEMIEREMSKSMDIDTSRLPPNALSKRQLSQGLAVLREIERILAPSIEDEENGTKENNVLNDGPSRELKLRDCSNRFYTIVPHCFDRKEIVPIIETVRTLKKRILNIEDLMQIVELEAIRSKSVSHANALHRPIPDMQYEELGCTLHVVGRDSDEWKLITTCIAETHAESHDTYTMEVSKILKIERPDEAAQLEADPCQTNRRMLWHGSRMSNWASILKNGLRIAPKEAPVTGYMFGKGVYFADSSSKSANYCFPTEDEPDGLLVLCDVALGKQYLRLEAQYEAPSKCRKKGFDSTWGVGQNAPLKQDQFSNGDILPTGPLQPNHKMLEAAKSEWPRAKPALQYNEFIVYRESQFAMKYVVHVKFNFTKKK